MCVTIFPMVYILSETLHYITKLVINASALSNCQVLTFYPLSRVRPVNELLSHFTRVPYSGQLYSDYVSYRKHGPSVAPVYGPSTLAPPVYGPSSIAPPHYGPSTVLPGKRSRKTFLLKSHLLRSLWPQHYRPVSALSQP